MRGKKIDGFPSREQALKDFFAAWQPNDSIEYVPLCESEGRITAQALVSKVTLPVYRSSACDGIAVRSSDFSGGFPDYRDWKIGRDFARADTGDDFADAFDAVIMIEEVDLTEDGGVGYISPDIRVQAGTNVEPAGGTIKEGDLLVGAGISIRPQDMAAMALGGVDMVPVWRRPKVAFLPTGSELVPPGIRPARGQNIDTNSLFVRRSLLHMGAEPILFPITPDDPALLKERLVRALEMADLVILNAGTAKGDEDFSFRLLGENGMLIHHYIAMAPGRPMALAVANGKPVINLPGPSLAALNGMNWCVQAAVNLWLHRPNQKKPRVKGVLMEDISSTPHMAILCMMNVAEENGTYFIYPVSMSDHNSAELLTADAIYVSEIGESTRAKGEMIEVELMRGLEYLSDNRG